MTTFFDPQPQRRTGRKVAFAVLALAALVGLGILLKALLGVGEAKKRNVVHQITLVKPPPPPPPPPKPPEVKKEEVKVEQPKQAEQPKAEAPPPGKQLGVDADGAAGSDAFGLAARKGGQDITLGAGANPRAQFAWYAALVQRHFEEASAKNRKLHGRSYQAVVKVWIARDGTVERIELAGSTGHGETDAALRSLVSGLPALKEPPPANMPQPLRMRVTSRG